VLSTSDDGTNTTIEVCNLFHARDLLKITNNLIEFEIISFNDSLNTILIGGLPDVTKAFVLQSPVYFHGTPMAQNTMLSEINDWRNKLPMIYLVEIFTESVNRDKELRLDKNADLTILFLDNMNYADWDTDESYTNRINPMRNLVNKFMDQLDSDKLVGTIDTATVVSHVKYGVFTTDKGHTDSILNEDLTGCALSVGVPIQKQLSGCNKAPCDC